jgi:hypothetical protein
MRAGLPHVRCSLCPRPERADSRTELVGGSEAYQPACRACYNEMQKKGPKLQGALVTGSP